MQKFLVAFDGTEPARHALTAGIELTQRFAGTLGVVSVIPVHPGRTPIDPWDDRAVHDEQLREARQIVTDAGLTAEYFEPAGNPAKAIEFAAEKGGFDTIVVGTRGLGSFDRMLQGSVSEHVATHAKATVIVAR